MKRGVSRGRMIVISLLIAACAACSHKPPPPTVGGACKDTRYECDSCSSSGILGSRHIHTDCTVSCDMICGRKEGY
jgi:hypothetical protein